MKQHKDEREKIQYMEKKINMNNVSNIFIEKKKHKIYIFF